MIKSWLPDTVKTHLEKTVFAFFCKSTKHIPAFKVTEIIANKPFQQLWKFFVGSHIWHNLFNNQNLLSAYPFLKKKSWYWASNEWNPYFYFPLLHWCGYGCDLSSFECVLLQENAHFSISEALIAAIEQVWSHLICATSLFHYFIFIF